jgi:membrane protease YdiL (CAAX protease family)
LIYRGYFVWVLAPWLGTVGALVAITAAFGIGHAYQGLKGILKTTAAGAVMALILVATGSLVPGMIVHAIIDAGSGAVGGAAFEEHGDPSAEDSVAA